MKTLKAVREEIQNLFDEVEAVLAVATKEQRELTKDEQARIDVINGVGDDTGELGKLKAEEARLQKVEDMRKEIAANRAAENRLFVRELNEELEPQNRQIVLPARAKKPVKHFESPEDAYTAGQFFLATLFDNEKSQQWCREHGIINTHTTKDNESGGYLVPEVAENAIIRLVEERGIFRRYSYNYPMGSGSVTVPRRLGGFTVYYPEEGQDGTESDLTLGQVKLDSVLAMVLTALSMQIDQDAAPTLASLITQELAYAFANAEDENGFNGDGTSSYGRVVGLKNALKAGSIVDAASGNIGASTLDLSDFENVVGKLPEYQGIQPVWFMHKSVYWASVQRLLDAAGGNTNNNLANGNMPELFGYPVQFVQNMVSTTGSSASTILAYFGDLSMASTFGLRRDVTVASDSSIYFKSGKIAIRGTERYAINVHERGDDDNPGPIIALKTAAS